MANTGLVILLVSRRGGAAVVGVAGTVLAVAAGPAAFALTAAAPVARTLTVALVQPGPTASPVLRADASQRLSAGLRRGHPGLIVWGESSIAFDLDTDTALRQQIERLSAADGAQILVNQDAVAPGGGKSKVAVLMGPGGIAGRYTKTRLVPFGEYIPFRQQLSFLTRISRAAPQNMTPGTGAHTLTVTAPGGPLRVGVLICFESAFPDMAASDADQGAQLIVYQTSDSTFQASWALAQHAALAALRAAETGRPAVQAALTGDSAAFDARGRLLAWAGAGDRGVLTARLALPPARARTPFDRYGPYVPWTAVVIAAAAAVTALVRAARGRSRTSRDYRPTRILWKRNLRPSPGVCVSNGSNGHDPSAQGQRATDGPPAGG
jgi:apolipoprotein N-acyltransferase